MYLQEDTIMVRRLGRQRFLSTAMGAALLGSVSTTKEMSTTDSTEKREVRLEFLRPKEIKASVAKL